MAIMFITHDLGVIAKMADHGAAMYLGKVVEHSDVDALFHDPKHPYLRALLSSVPRFGGSVQERLQSIEGHRARSVPPAGRLPLPPALPGVDRRPVRGGRAGIPHAAGRAAPRRGVPSAHTAGPASGRCTMSGAPGGDDLLLQVSGLRKHFPIQKGLFGRAVGQVKAVDGVDFTINKGETLGLVGESGCGKSTTGRCLLRGHDLTAGEIWFNDQDLGWVDVFGLDRNQLKVFRRHAQMILQDPFHSLNPRMTLLDIVGEGLTIAARWWSSISAGSPTSSSRATSGALSTGSSRCHR